MVNCSPFLWNPLAIPAAPMTHPALFAQAMRRRVLLDSHRRFANDLLLEDGSFDPDLFLCYLARRSCVVCSVPSGRLVTIVYGAK